MVQLIKSDVPNDALKCAIHFAEGVESGEIVGAVIGFMYRRRKYSVVVCGLAKDDPTFARGVAQVIDDELSDLIHERSHRDTTL